MGPIQQLNVLDATLISFNFPDHDIQDRNGCQLTSGTSDELLPALYVLKKQVIDRGLKSIDLYGFSAGGGAVVNVIAALNNTAHDAKLKQIGIGHDEKRQLLNGIQRGLVVLDSPLKSVEEIIDLRGSTEELEILAKNYRENGLRPIDSLQRLTGLSLDIILHFQNPDEILFNRDDAFYIDRLKKANSKGTTAVVIGSDGGHVVPHTSLWQFYSQKISQSTNPAI
jgi:hypothetical protein